MKVKISLLLLLLIVMPLVNSISVVDISSTEALYNYTESDPIWNSEKSNYLSYSGLTNNINANYYNIYNINNIYNKSEIDGKIAGLIDEETDPLSYHTDENINATGYNISADKITSYGNNVASYELTELNNGVTLKWIR